jgi:hypothetical protein
MDLLFRCQVGLRKKEEKIILDQLTGANENESQGRAKQNPKSRFKSLTRYHATSLSHLFLVWFGLVWLGKHAGHKLIQSRVQS